MRGHDRRGSDDEAMIGYMTQMRDEMTRFVMEYEFAVQELLTKVTILRHEFLNLHHYNPIEHVTSRVKSSPSIVRKAIRKGVPPELAAIREHITDIGGVRITCSFISDTYRVLEALTSQDDVRVIAVKDYIAHPKPNGYKSLHALLEIPVFLSSGRVDVTVELQVRTVAMDFWATTEHKIFYKFDGHVPQRLIDDLTTAAQTAAELDRRMEQLHTEVHGVDARSPGAQTDIDDDVLRYFWEHARNSWD
ncbi:GTP pyrophosphokinase [Nocardia shimofusensis]|uniref:GTP pyrophosphokinase n=1 Tax=Nocardia shimofusensis TaxID=228596 RepID=UPI0008310C8B|nr:GTP pyrophosphokinase family protein [Nocardia shimofusensis]